VAIAGSIDPGAFRRQSNAANCAPGKRCGTTRRGTARAVRVRRAAPSGHRGGRNAPPSAISETLNSIDEA
jgi:hypothetical protein